MVEAEVSIDLAVKCFLIYRDFEQLHQRVKDLRNSVDYVPGNDIQNEVRVTVDVLNTVFNAVENHNIFHQSIIQLGEENLDDEF